MSYDPNRYYELLESRLPLITERNKYTDSLFWWTPWNRKKLAAIDAKLDIIDLEIHKERKKLIEHP